MGVPPQRVVMVAFAAVGFAKGETYESMHAGVRLLPSASSMVECVTLRASAWAIRFHCCCWHEAVVRL
jgi:hypothetical protein